MYIRKSTRVTVLALARNGEGGGGGVLEMEDEEGGSAEAIKTYYGIGAPDWQPPENTQWTLPQRPILPN